MKTSKTLVDNIYFQFKINRTKPLKYNSSKITNPKLFTERYQKRKLNHNRMNLIMKMKIKEVFIQKLNLFNTFNLSKKYIT